MPPKPRITREMILEAAFALAREQGIGAVSARSIADRLGCSTQPVLYHFTRVEAVRSEVYRMADEMHSAYLMQLAPEQNPMLSIGLNYIRFAAEEKPLFRLLFQSDGLGGGSVAALADVPELSGVMEVLGQESGLTEKQCRRVFLALLMLVHGWASFLANNSMAYVEGEIAPMLELAFDGLVGAMMREETDG